MQTPGPGIRLRSSARSDTGRVRDNNEDRVHLWKHTHGVLAVVADGMGGAVAGEEASRITIETVQADLVDNDALAETFDIADDDVVMERMRQAIHIANETILKKADHYPELKGMGTTVTMAFVRGSHVLIGHVGDSRAYIVGADSGEIVQITSDHSFVQALVSAGHISAAEADEHPMKNVLYRALGQAHDVEIDIHHAILHLNDRLVLCSDGLTLHIKPLEIAQVALASEDPEDISRKLIDLANERGGRDNVSVIVIKAEADGETASHNADFAGDYQYTDEDTLIIGRDSGHFGSSESPGTPDLDGLLDHHEHAPFAADAPTKGTIRARAVPQRATGEHRPPPPLVNGSTPHPDDLAGEESSIDLLGEDRDPHQE